jgi:hypothetical protein
MEKTGYIYALMNPLTKEIKYIGKTLNIEQRYSRHLQEGQYCRTHKEKWINSLQKLNIQPEIKILIKTTSNLLNNLEIELIKHYKQFCKLTNGTEGGDGTRKPQTEKVKQRMRENNPMHNKETALRVNRKIAEKRRKPILQYDLNGNFIQEFSGLRVAERILNFDSSAISACCTGKSKTYKKFIWKFKN